MKQKIISNNYEEIMDWINSTHIKRLLLVCGASIKSHEKLYNYFLGLPKNNVDVVFFSDFKPNPTYESVVAGVNCFKDNACNGILAVGGGSAMDVAKCIKIYSNLDSSQNYLKQSIIPNTIPFLAIPTTAGTGSEATKFAVIYYQGDKQSVADDSCIPDTVMLNSELLNSLPLYQRKATMMDAFCHAIESYWSVNSTEQSKEYGRKALELINKHMSGYLDNTNEGNEGMLKAAYYAGKAINITQTTAGHAMCYKLTSMFGLAHGHATILCNRILYPWMVKSIEKCRDVRGKEYLGTVFEELADILGYDNLSNVDSGMRRLFESLELEVPVATLEQVEELVHSVNIDRLKNNPIELNEDDIRELYSEIVKVI